MKIDQAHTTKEDGMPVLHLVIDGHAAYVIEPKLTLLDRGIVVLLDDAGYWERALSVMFPPDPADGRPESIELKGATNDPAIATLVRRVFVKGEEV